jgi:hypothetical protein
MSEDEIIPPGGDALEFLQACYLNQDLTVGERMRAAGIAIQFERPKLQAIAHLVDGNLGDRLTKARARVAEFQARRDAGELTMVHDGKEFVVEPRKVDGDKLPVQRRFD